MKKILLAIFVVLFTAATVFSGEFEDTLKKAEQGDASAQYSLGLKFLTGDGTKKDELEGNRWIRIAAENGKAEAQLFYGQRLPDKIKGLDWIKKAVKSDLTAAQHYLGELYLTDDNPYLTKDIEQAIYWLTIVANKNDMIFPGCSEKAIFRLAMMYEDGNGVEKNLTKASEWLNKLVDSPHYLNTEDLYNFGNQQLSKDIIKLRVAAERGHPGAQYELGIMYMYGYVKLYYSPKLQFKIKQDKEKCLKWLQLASASPTKGAEWNANYMLGTIYDYGLVDLISKPAGYLIKNNNLEALKYYEWAAREGYKKAQNELDKINEYEVNDWGEEYMESGTLTRYRDSMFIRFRFETEISFSKAGKKRIYFSISESKSTCKPEDYNSSSGDSTWEFNNQAVSMVMFCNEGPDNRYDISATPRSDQGADYVIELFRKSPDKIWVKGFGYEFPISAIGFTKVWKSRSASAL